MRNVLNRLMLSFLGVLLLGMASGTAHASQWHRFMQPRPNPQVLSQDVAKNLAEYPDGNHAIDGPNCGRTCATPGDLLDMLQHADPTAHLEDVKQLPAYLASLVVAKAPEGEFMMACKGGDGSADAPPIWDCMSRHFHAGEPCFMDPRTHICVLAHDCTNPVGVRIELSGCLELHVGLMAGDEIHIGFLSNAGFPEGRCRVLIQKTGVEGHGTPPLDECPRDRCDFSAPSAYLHLPVREQPRISWIAQAAGDNVILLPTEFLKQNGVLVLCVVKPDGRQTLGRVIDKTSFIEGKSYVLYHGWSLDAPWDGRPYEWHFADEAEPHLN